jgi:predicted MFS family arabinose efflux permease
MSVSAPDAVRVEGAVGAVRARWYPHYVLVILLLSYAVNFMDRNVMSTLIDPIKAELGVSDTLMGLLVGFGFAIFNSIAGIPIARWADRGDRRAIMALGMVVFSSLTVLSGLARNFWHLAVARVGVAVGEATGVPPAHSMIADYFSKETRAWAMAVFQSSLYLGIFLGYFVGGWFGEYYGWRMAFFVAGAPGLLIALLLWLTVDEPQRKGADDKPDRGVVEPLGDVLRFLAAQRAFLCIALGIALVSLSNYSLSVWVPSFLRRIHGASGAEIGTVVAVIKGAAGAAGTLAGGFLIGKIAGRDTRVHLLLTAVVTALVAPALVVFLFAASKDVAYTAFAVSIVLVGFHYGPCYAIVQSLVRARMRSVASSVVFLGISLIGLGCGPFLIGLFNDLLSSRLAEQSVRYSLLLSVVAAALGAACFLLACRFVTADLRRAET